MSGAAATTLRSLAVGAVGDAPAWVVGGAVRDELLGRQVVDLDVICGDPELAARQAARLARGTPFPLSERHGAWRLVLDDGRTVDFTPLAGTLAEDLALRDFTVNAIASPLAGGEPIDPHGGIADLGAGVLRLVSPGALDADPVRLLRAVRFEDELGLAMDAPTESAVRERAALVTRPAGERVLAEVRRLSPRGWRRLDEVGLLAALGGSAAALPDGPARDGAPADLLLVAALGESLLRLPVSNDQRRYARTLLAAVSPAAPAPRDVGPRAIHRFRRATEPWALDALALLAARGALPGLEALTVAVEQARAADPAEPLLRGDELGLPPGPEIGRLLALVEEERAAGTITTRDEALALARREGAP